MLVIDAEWPTKSDGIHMVGVYCTDDGSYEQVENAETFRTILAVRPDDVLCGHALIYADLPRFKKHWGIDLSDRMVVDTYTMSCYYRPNMEDNKGHSLSSWGERLGMHKGDFTDFDAPADGEAYADWWDRMGVYMKQDVLLTYKLQLYLSDKLTEHGFSSDSLVTELKIAHIVQQQMDNGFYFDIDKATSLYVLLTSRHKAVKLVLQDEFPPITIQRTSEKTGKRLKDNVTVFNPGSRQQVANRLMSRGVKLTDKTKTGQWKISDEILETLTHPAAKNIHEYMMLEKRIGQMDQWFYYYNEDTHRIHGRVNPLGANTHRQTQSKPNLAQIPSTRKPYGEKCRELFTVPEECKLVGVDASGLELRLLANRLEDPEYKKQVETGDIHKYNMELAGLHDRDTAKTFIYAFIYGAQDHKLGSILGCSGGEAAQVRARFLKAIPALDRFKERVTRESKATGNITLLDGSKVWVKSMHSILNYQLQGDGAVVMKRALVLAQPSLVQTTAKLVVQAHDEWQFETAFYDCDLVGKVAVKAIEKVSSEFDMYVKLAAEYKIGKSWADTH